MARKKQKYEFRPDKQSSNLLNKLYLTQKQRKTLLKWVLYGVILLILSVLQDTVFCHIRFWGARLDLVPCAIVLICVVQGAESGSIFILVASSLFLFTGTAPGAYVIAYMTVLGLIVTLIRQSYLRNGFSAVMLCTAVAFLLYEIAVFFTGLYLQQTTLDKLFRFLITAGLTFPLAPILYPAVLAVDKVGGDTWKE